MYHYVYILKTLNGYIKKSYVGYSTDVVARLNKHNSSKGAKFTKGRFWKLIYFKIYKTKIKALKEEYKLKKDYKLRSNIKKILMLWVKSMKIFGITKKLFN